LHWAMSVMVGMAGGCRLLSSSSGMGVSPSPRAGAVVYPQQRAGFRRVGGQWRFGVGLERSVACGVVSPEQGTTMSMASDASEAAARAAVEGSLNKAEARGEIPRQKGDEGRAGKGQARGGARGRRGGGGSGGRGGGGASSRDSSRRPRGGKVAAAKREQRWAQLVEGQIVVGDVNQCTEFGAFVDIGVVVDGLLHISEVSNSFVKDIKDYVAAGDRITVRVKSVDRERRKVQLTMKEPVAKPGPLPGIGSMDDLPGASAVLDAWVASPPADVARASRGSRDEAEYALDNAAAGPGAKEDTVTVSQVMSRSPVCLPLDARLADATRAILENRISGVPIVNEQGRCCGVLSETDLIYVTGAGPVGADGAVYAADAERVLNEGLVSDAMTPEPIVVRPDRRIGSAAEMMLRRRISRVVVVDDDQKPVGLLTRSDILRYIASKAGVQK